MMEYKEDDFLMVSGIQHFAYCRRQWALIHIEQQWAENIHTVEGELMHKRAHDPKLSEKSRDVLVVRAMPISSWSLGVSGECDVLEFKKSEDGIKLHGHRGLYKIYPIEYKRGKPKNTDIDILQLTAQVMCLEEMFSAEIEEGAIFYGEIRRRERVIITDELRTKVFRNASVISEGTYTQSQMEQKLQCVFFKGDLCSEAGKSQKCRQIYG